MLKKTFMCVSLMACMCFCITSLSVVAAEENGPETIVLKTTKDKAKKPKTVNFPHRDHQKRLKNDCSLCHHNQDKDNKQTPYVAGQKIEKCETCHFKGSSMPAKSDKAKGIAKLDTFKDAAHARCKTCHKKQMKENPELKKKWKKCLPCHVKK